MSKHTPGPWTTEDRVERLLVWADGSHDFVAELPAVADGADSDAQAAYEQEQEANARLIAAAPALLEECKTALAAWHSSHCKRLQFVTSECPDILCASLSAAIAKAEGKS